MFSLWNSCYNYIFLLPSNQKENKVLSGVEVLIQAVNKDTSRHGELESKKGITERKIEELKRQLKKAEGKTDLPTHPCNLDFHVTHMCSDNVSKEWNKGNQTCKLLYVSE